MGRELDQMAYPHLCGLLGVKPSRLSYAMHSAAFDALKLPFTYTAFDTTDTCAGLTAMRKLGFRGLSLTIPHKEQALAFIDEVDDEASQIKAVNTVINVEGVLRGYNTDWHGVIGALCEASFEGKGKTALLFGAGGASRAALFALKKLGVERIIVTNRNEKRGVSLADEFQADFVPFAKLNKAFFRDFELFINATPIGLPSAGGADYPFSFEVFSERHTVFDMVTRETKLLSSAQAKGAKTVPGIRMLLHQALPQFEYFTQQEAPQEVMETALYKELTR